MEISELPDFFPIIKSLEIIEFERDSDQYYRAKIIFKGNSELHIKEYFNSQLAKHDYSFHWQTAFGNIIKRWDNAPHHKKIKTFPFHLHTPERILPSEELFIEDVLKIISFELDRLKHH